ncbi:hypothetical protein H6G74_19850 [Nostoc spongiaeforme FACHB-130]|uniref:MACPF domain-containing protein n=1 Tax=Nostoc spongiaeforme FACHB-130 TaxID=1357510 RepID=A0ABR8G025_9NOSO|nr:MAC/perforin domain-containing protein [Nostoc spongiaeforme]MBD2596568.1 hypothetical protein [Nostoc spongiaeforme FACHB-130]
MQLQELTTNNISPLKNWDVISRGYNILEIDPLHLVDNSGLRMVFDLEATIPLLDGSGIKSSEFLHISESSGLLDATTAVIFSAYDLQSFLHQNINFNINDSIGELFAYSRSSTYENITQEIEYNEKVVIYTKVSINNYKLQLDKTKARKLNGYFQKLVADIYYKSSLLLQEFGTHYAYAVFYGGQAYHKLAFTKENFISMLGNHINVKTEAQSTFDVLKFGNSIATASILNQDFRDNIENQYEQINYSSETQFQNFHDWAKSVKTNPTPIKLELVPLYNLLTKKYFPEDENIEQKQIYLKNQIDKYIINNGHNPSQSVIRYGDEIEMSIAAKGQPRYLCYADKVKYAKTESELQCLSGNHLQKYRWKILATKQEDFNQPVRNDDLVVLQSQASNLYLDAKSGRDETYFPGEGLTSANQNNPQLVSAKWKIEQLNLAERREVVDGDYLRLQTQWKNDDGEYGYLKGETSLTTAEEQKERVFSFGKGRHQSGCYWKINKVGYYNKSTAATHNNNKNQRITKSLQLYCTINNRCDLILKVKEYYYAEQCCPNHESSPPKDVPAKQVIQVLAMSGTEGYVIYQLGDDPNAWIKIFWDRISGFQIETFHEDIVVQCDGFIGSALVENVLLKIADVR